VNQLLGDPRALQQRGNADSEKFDASQADALAALRAARRADQEALAEAAKHFAEQYQTIMGERVRQVLQAAEFAESPELLRMRLNELLEEAPPAETLEKLSRASFFARMMGAFRAKR